jgi:hypothetical protein
MSEHSNQELLRASVIEASVADNWDKAKLEWSLVNIYDAEDGTCECGHHIVQHCVICNVNNHTELVVGNVCINHFGVDALTVPPAARASLRRIRDEIDGGSEEVSVRANGALLDVAWRLSIISNAEVDRYETLTTGPGSRTRFQEDHENYDQVAVDFVNKVNHLIFFGFRAERPRCKCHEFAKPRQNGAKGTYFFSCARFPNGCRWSENINF